jgi:hypothetical protein
MAEQRWHHIAYISLLATCVLLEIFATGAGGLWVLAGFWTVFKYF